MADWWMQSGTTSTAAGANAPLMPGTAAITAAELAAGAVTEADIASGAVTVTKLGALSVTSEKASANLVQRSVSVVAGSTSGTGFTSTSLALFTAPVPITITSIRVAPMTAWTVATCGSAFVVWACTAGEICSYCASSTGVMKTVGDVNSCFVLNSTGVTLAACESIRLKCALAGTTSCAQVAHFQIDYVTSG